MTVAAVLAEVETAIEKGDEVAALGHALAAWQHCRHARITAVIEHLSSTASRTRSLPGGKTAADKQAAWLALAAAREPADLGLLLATLLDVRKADLLEQRLNALKGRSDPRIAKVMHAVMEEPPVPGSQGTGTLVAAMELVVAIADPRSDDAWTRLVRIVGDRGGGPATEGLRKRMPSGSTRLRAALDEVTSELSAEAAARLDAIERRLTPVRVHSAAELLAAVYAKPEDDQPRMVLADLLQEAGDPRGELIALQLGNTGKRSKREKELLDAHAHEWLGAIAPVVARTDLVYERGFVAKCSIRDDGIKDTSSFVGLPEWRTVTELDVWSWDGDPCALLAGMPGLRVLRGVRRPQQLPRHDAIERLQIGVIGTVEELAALDGLPALRALEIDGCWRPFDDFTAFWRSPTATRLTELSVAANQDWIPGLLTLGIARIGYRSRYRSGWRLWFEGDVVTIEMLSKHASTGALCTMLDLVEERQNKRVVLAGNVTIDRDLGPVLASFADYRLAE